MSTVAAIRAVERASTESLTAMRPANNNSKILPAEVMSRLLDDESPIRVWREHMNVSVGDLSTHTGLAVSYIIELETGDREPPPWALRRLAEALSLDVEELLA